MAAIAARTAPVPVLGSDHEAVLSECTAEGVPQRWLLCPSAESRPLLLTPERRLGVHGGGPGAHCLDLPELRGLKARSRRQGRGTQKPLRAHRLEHRQLME